MTNRTVSLLTAAVCAVSLLTVAPAPTTGQSYPKLLVNGPGLALTRLAVQQKNGTSWGVAPTYQAGTEYRMIVRMTNFFPPPNYVGIPSAGCHVNSLVDLRAVVKLAGAQFTSVTGGPAQVGSGFAEIDDPNRLDNTESRSYYLYFRYNGPSGMPVSALMPQVNIRAGQVCVLPNMPPTAIRPTS